MGINVNEIFYSIQGESTYAGLACVFVRLCGCNLRCRYCDTRYAYDEGQQMEIGEIVDKVSGFGCGLVEITGGEPLLQEETPALADALVARGFDVLVETNGSLDISAVNDACIKIVDIKCPSSGENDKNDMKNIGRLGHLDQVKFVIADRADYVFAKKTSCSITAIPKSQVLFSPVYGLLAPATLAEWILKDALDVRLHLQQHKTIWPDERGR